MSFYEFILSFESPGLVILVLSVSVLFFLSGLSEFIVSLTLALKGTAEDKEDEVQPVPDRVVLCGDGNSRVVSKGVETPSD